MDLQDGGKLLQLARRHRVQPLCWHGLGDAGSMLAPAIRSAFKSDLDATTAGGLRTLAASRELLDQFEKAGVALLFLKGQAVGQLAYGDPFLKTSSDLDILVGPQDIPAAAAQLQQLGYEPLLPKGSVPIEEWHRANKESVWTRDGSPPLELHSRLADHPSLLRGMGLSSPKQMVTVGSGVSVPTLADPELFAYLAVHGASSAWFRLKWLCDFAALIHDRSEADIERLHRRAASIGAGRASGLALLLSKRFFGTPVGSSLVAELRRDRALQLLENLSLRQLCSIEEPTRRPLGTLGIHCSQLLIKPGLTFAASEAVRQMAALSRRVSRSWSGQGPGLS